MRFVETVSASLQDYLEAMLDLSDIEDAVRSVDIAAKIGVSRASVSRAAGVLRDAGFIEQERYGELTLTKNGREEAVRVRARHNILKSFLCKKLGVAEETAEADACKMEHAISEETFEKLKIFMEK